jgi:hypothetical protein
MIDSDIRAGTGTLVDGANKSGARYQGTIVTSFAVLRPVLGRACVVMSAAVILADLALAGPALADTSTAGTLTAPAFTASGGSDFQWQLTLPDDPDLTAVHVRYEAGTAPMTTPTDGTGLADYDVGPNWYHPGQTVTDNTYTLNLDPMQTYTIAAIAEDSAGDVTTTSVVRGPATLVDGSPVGGFHYQAQSDGTTFLVWSTGGASSVRYAPGATPPATPDDGTQLGQLSSAWGPAVSVPAPNGQSVALSFFLFHSQYDNTYQQQTLVLQGGASSDHVQLLAPSVAHWNTTPVITASVTRTTGDGVTPLANVGLSLYARTAAKPNWQLLAGATTGSDGKTAAFHLQWPQQANTQYEVRESSTDPTPLVQDAFVASNGVISVTWPKAAVLHGHAVKIAGHEPSGTNHVMQLQQLVAGKWQTVSKTRTVPGDATGTFVFTYTPSRTGAEVLRVYQPATPIMVASTSGTHKLTVH